MKNTNRNATIKKATWATSLLLFTIIATGCGSVVSDTGTVGVSQTNQMNQANGQRTLVELPNNRKGLCQSVAQDPDNCRLPGLKFMKAKEKFVSLREEFGRNDG